MIAFESIFLKVHHLLSLLEFFFVDYMLDKGYDKAENEDSRKDKQTQDVALSEAFGFSRAA